VLPDDVSRQGYDFVNSGLGHDLGPPASIASRYLEENIEKDGSLLYSSFESTGTLLDSPRLTIEIAAHRIMTAFWAKSDLALLQNLSPAFDTLT